MAKHSKKPSKNRSRRPTAARRATKPPVPAASPPLPPPLSTAWPPLADDWVVVGGEVFVREENLGKLQTKFSQHLRYVERRDGVYRFVAIDGKPFDPANLPVLPTAATASTDALKANEYLLGGPDWDSARPMLTEIRFPGLLRIALGIVRKFKLTEDTWPYPTREWLEAEILRHWKLYDGRAFLPEEIETLLNVILSTRARRGGRPPKEKWRPPEV